MVWVHGVVWARGFVGETDLRLWEYFLPAERLLVVNLLAGVFLVRVVLVEVFHRGEVDRGDCPVAVFFFSARPYRAI